MSRYFILFVALALIVCLAITFGQADPAKPVVGEQASEVSAPASSVGAVSSLLPNNERKTTTTQPALARLRSLHILSPDDAAATPGQSALRGDHGELWIRDFSALTGVKVSPPIPTVGVETVFLDELRESRTGSDSALEASARVFVVRAEGAASSATEERSRSESIYVLVAAKLQVKSLQGFPCWNPTYQVPKGESELRDFCVVYGDSYIDRITEGYLLIVRAQVRSHDSSRRSAVRAALEVSLGSVEVDVRARQSALQTLRSADIDLRATVLGGQLKGGGASRALLLGADSVSEFLSDLRSERIDLKPGPILAQTVSISVPLMQDHPSLARAILKDLDLHDQLRQEVRQLRAALLAPAPSHVTGDYVCNHNNRVATVSHVYGALYLFVNEYSAGDPQARTYSARWDGEARLFKLGEDGHTATFVPEANVLIFNRGSTIWKRK